MDEMLDLVRRELRPASCYSDEATGNFVWIDNETRDKMYGRLTYLHGEVRAQQQEVRGRYLIVGACLAEIERDKLYTCVCQGTAIDGYSNFYKFCQAVFGFKRTTVQNILAVYRKFSTEQGLIRAEYFNFSYSQLVELSRMQKYAERVTVNCSRRDIQHLRELYEEYVPKPGTPVEEDLAEWKKRNEKKKAEANAAKNAITFIPAKKSVGSDVKTECQPAGTQEEEQDEREISTPDVGMKVSEDAVVKGLLRQLELLKSCNGDKWEKFAETVSFALEHGIPKTVHSMDEMREKRREITKLQLENLDLQKKLGEGIKKKSFRVDRAEKINFKNDDARKEFLKIEKRKTWPLWIEIPDVGVRMYKIEFANGDSLVAQFGKCYPNYAADRNRAYEYDSLHLMTKEHPEFDCNGISVTAVLEYMKAHRTEI